MSLSFAVHVMAQCIMAKKRRIMKLEIEHTNFSYQNWVEDGTLVIIFQIFTSDLTLFSFYCIG